MWFEGPRETDVQNLGETRSRGETIKEKRPRDWGSQPMQGWSCGRGDRGKNQTSRMKKRLGAPSISD